MSGQKPPVAGLVRTLRTVGSAMIGVRSRKRHEEDTATLSPVMVIIAVVCFMAALVGVLITVAVTVVGK